SGVPAPTPASWWVARATWTRGSSAGHVRHPGLAASICSITRPVVPTGKKRSGSVSRHAARQRQSSSFHSYVRLHVRATLASESGHLVNSFTRARVGLQAQGIFGVQDSKPCLLAIASSFWAGR